MYHPLWLIDVPELTRWCTWVVRGGECRVYDGPLVGLESRVVRFNRGRAYVLVRMREGADIYLTKMPLAITARR